MYFVLFLISNMEVIMGETINIKELFQTVKKRFWLVGLITIVMAIMATVVSFFVMTPVYSVKTQILVNQAKSDQQLYNNNQVQTDIQLVDTYSVIIESPTILDEVKSKLNLNQTVDQLIDQISVENAPGSQVVEISVEDQSAKQAVLIANTTAEVFKNKISSLMNVDNVNVLSKAKLKEDMGPVSPKPLLNIAAAVLAGLMLGTGLVLLLEYMDSTIKSEDDIEKHLDLPVMGVIMNIEDIPAPTTKSSRVAGQHSRVRGESIGS